MDCINGNTDCGCLNGSVGILNTDIKGTVGLSAKPINGSVGVLNISFKGITGFSGKPICGSIGALDTSINGKVGIICTPNTDAYLFVEPEVIWLTPDIMSADFVVKSNTKWIIE